MRVVLRFFRIVCLLIPNIALAGISGVVTDADTGETLLGATVFLSQDDNLLSNGDEGVGAIANMYGEFEIKKLPENAKFVVFSYIGYETQFWPLEDGKVYDIKLKENANALEDVDILKNSLEGKDCAPGILNHLNASRGVYAKRESKLYCDILVCNDNYTEQQFEQTFNYTSGGEEGQTTQYEVCKCLKPFVESCTDSNCVCNTKIGQPCAQDLLGSLNAKAGQYAEDANSGDIYCDITDCKENFVEMSQKQEDTYSDGEITVNVYNTCECPNDTHTINDAGECVVFEISVAGNVFDEDGNQISDARILFTKTDNTVETMNGGGFSIRTQRGKDVTFSADGYESVINAYKEDKNNERIVLKKMAVAEEVALEEEEQETLEDKQPITPYEKPHSETRIKELKANLASAKEREKSEANKILGATGIGTTGVGGMMLMQGLAEQSADTDAEQEMRAYLATFNCSYGNNSAQGGDNDIELPGGNELLPLYSEYVTLANNVKSKKTELGIKPGIESESILDGATSGLYDDISTGKTAGAFVSLARALQNPGGEDAKKWAEQSESVSQNIKTGAITAGAGAGASLVGHITESAVYKKKAEKGEKKSDAK